MYNPHIADETTLALKLHLLKGTYYFILAFNLSINTGSLIPWAASIGTGTATCPISSSSNVIDLLKNIARLLAFSPDGEAVNLPVRLLRTTYIRHRVSIFVPEKC